jgi:hypothetical protein
MAVPVPVVAVMLSIILALVLPSEGFHLPVSPASSKNPLRLLTGMQTRQSSLYFWGNEKKNKDAASEASPDEEENDKSSAAGGIGGVRFGGLLPFFANNNNNKEESMVKKQEQQQQQQETEEDATMVAVASKPLDPVIPSPSPPQRKQPQQEELDPVERAKALRAQAERVRLEAEKMDAELTLSKISRLEREMASAITKDETDNVERLQREMDVLQAKVRGEVVVTNKRPAAANVKTATTTTFTATNTERLPLEPFTDEAIAEMIKSLDRSPSFMRKLFAQMLEFDFETAEDINNTALVERMIQMQNMDFSYSKLPKPTFTKAEIEQAIRDKEFGLAFIDESRLPDSIKGNETAKALLALENAYYVRDFDQNKLVQALNGEDWLKSVTDALNKTEVDAIIEISYPKCTRKEGASLPSEAEVKRLVTEVLPKASFTTRGEPQKVLGGYIVRGTSKFNSGDETIAAIQEQLTKYTLQDKMTVVYAKDFSSIISEDGEFGTLADMRDPDDVPPILYIMGPDIVPERKRIPLTLATSFGIATSWYLSVYPFLLNPAIMKRTEEQLALADASMAYDLSWLTELSLPLFVTFMGIQLAHEAGHKLAGAAYGLPTTFPTFVPSLVTGVTSTVTQFKEPPKNKEAMFDVAIAGPLAGMIASISALVVGSQLTLFSDPSVLPALPLDILRQSTLGGGIIDALLGAGALSVPLGAEASLAVAGMTVSLHPVAVAGYIGLILNGLALLPVGSEWPYIWVFYLRHELTFSRLILDHTSHGRREN